MINVFMESQMHDIEFALNAGYKTLIYDGNLDMIADMQWDGKADYDKAMRTVYHYGSEVVGYLKKAQNLDLLVVRNAGHMVPLSQPPWAQQMIEDFTSGNM